MQNADLLWLILIEQNCKIHICCFVSSEFMFYILAKDTKLRGLAAPSNLTMNQALDSHKGMNNDLLLAYAGHFCRCVLLLVHINDQFIYRTFNIYECIIAVV